MSYYDFRDNVSPKDDAWLREQEESEASQYFWYFLGLKELLNGSSHNDDSSMDIVAAIEEMLFDMSNQNTKLVWSEFIDFLNSYPKFSDDEKATIAFALLCHAEGCENRKTFAVKGFQEQVDKFLSMEESLINMLKAQDDLDSIYSAPEYRDFRKDHGVSYVEGEVFSLNDFLRSKTIPAWWGKFVGSYHIGELR